MRPCCLSSSYIFLIPALQVSPATGTVGFGSGLHGWAFTLKQFAEMYSSKFGIDEKKLMRKLWGDSFYNAKTKKWEKDDSGGGRRAFCQFILDTILKVYGVLKNGGFLSILEDISFCMHFIYRK